ncbi:ORF64 [Retroperitoneal fibromatosis-associated herpesvirus]|uniref:ORF64 n=1 Tax=Retroperitoneal fibromatosis-associated herpesvirus TaxID=111469 RepID=U5NIH0_9GAMA|nr:ORF64 [Retroperitoneal fibromatosis-associated herpesvirus]AGY30750.1 ORF64 [Retroperitoneal fibromatosis-associated herpesvirus]
MAQPPPLRMEGVASTHQADPRFGIHAGSQCLSNCVMYLASCYYNRETPLLDTPSLDDILEKGSRLDFILRQSGLLGFQQYAQLHHIPSYLRTDAWTTKIFQSAEFFGLLGQEAAIREPFIESLRSVLGRNYAGTVQYFVVICQAKSRAILIKDKAFFMFDPHCIPHLPNSPAHVLKTDDVPTLLSYIATPDTEYTGCFLYFLPNDYVSPEHYITNHYRTITFEELHGPQVDIATGVEAASITEIDSPPGSPTRPDTHTTSGDTHEDDVPPRRPRIVIPPYPPPGTPRPRRKNRGTPPSPEPPGINQTHNRPDASHRSTGTQASTQDTPTRGDDGVEADVPNDTTQHANEISETTRSSEAGENEAPPMEATTTEPGPDTNAPVTAPGADVLLADLAAARGQKRKISEITDQDDTDPRRRAAVDAGLDTNETEDIWIDDPPEPLYPPTETPSFDVTIDVSTSALTPDEELITEDAESDLEPERPREFIRFSEATPEALSTAVVKLDIGPLDALIKNLNPATTGQAIPVIVDSTNARPFRESAALRDMDRLLTHVILEHGPISSALTAGPSKCIHALQFFILWGNKLGIPVADAKRVLKAELTIPSLCNLVQEQQITSPTFLKHLTNKLNMVLRAMHPKTTPNFRTIIQQINTEGIKIASMEEETSTVTLGHTIATRLGSDFTVVCSNEDIQTIMEGIRRLRDEIKKRNAQIQDEEGRFQSVLVAIDTNQPPPNSDQAFEILPDKKLRIVVEHLTLAEARITTQLVEGLQAYIDGTSETDTVLTNVPNISQVLGSLGNTLKTIKHVAERLQTNTAALDPFRQQLMYIGGELSSMFTLDWPHPPTEPIQPLEILQILRKKITQAEARVQSQSALDQILTDAETLLQNITDPSSAQYRTQSVSIPVLENYIQNAGVLLGHEKNARYVKLKTAIQTLVTSETFLTMTLHDTSLANVITNAAKIGEAFAANPALIGRPAVKQALTAACDLVIREALDALERRDPAALPQGTTLAMETLLDYGSVRDHKELIRIIAEIASVQATVREGDKDRWNTAIASLTQLKSTLAAAAMEAPVKRRLYRLIQGDLKEAQKNQTRLLEESWKNKVLAFVPRSADEALDFLKGAPSAKAREFAKQHFTRQHGLHLETPTQDATVAMEYSPTPLPNTKEIDKATADRGAQAWKRIQQAFADYTFHTIHSTDWEALAAEYQRPGSALPSTVGAVLTSLLEGVLQALDALHDQRLRSFLPDAAPFQPPSFDWLTPYQNHVSFFLRIIGLPLVRTLAEKIDVRAQHVIHALNATDLQQATAGTHLENAAREYEGLAAELTSTYNDHGIRARSEAADYIDAIHSAAVVVTPERPTLVVPKTYIPSARIPSVDALPEFLKTAIRQQDARCLAQQRAAFEDIDREIRAAEAQRKAGREESTRKMSHALAQMLQRAPVAISGRPLNPQAPTGFLESIVHEDVLGRETYEVARQGFEWLEYTVKALTVYAVLDEQQKLQRLTEEATKQRHIVEACLALEDAANRADDADALEQAVKGLSSHRVVGGKATVDGWKSKLEEIRSLVKAAEQTSVLLADLDLTAGRAQATMSTAELTELYQRCQETLGNLKSDTAKAPMVTLREKLSELQSYIHYKKQFLEYFVSTQPAIFSAFPLTREVVGDLPPNPLPFETAGRLRAYAWLTHAKAPIERWILTTPIFDPDSPAAIPEGGREPPLHRQLIFLNFLEALLPAATETSLHDPTVGLPGTAAARRGAEAASWFLNQWEDVSRLLPEVLETYADSAPALTDKTSNRFLAMCVFTYLIYAASPTVSVPSSDEIPIDAFPEEIAIQPRDLIYLLTAIWPTWVSAVLKEGSYAEALQVCTFTLAPLLRAVPYLAIRPPEFVSKFPPPRLQNYGAPEAFPFFPDEWQTIDVRDQLWQRKEFLAMCHRSPSRARIACLVWALTHLHPASVEHLWASLRPLNVSASDTPVTLLRALTEAEFGPPVPDPTLEAKENEPPYQYGRPSGSMLTMRTPDRLPRHDGPPVSGFEVALGAILFNARLRIFVTASTHRISKTRGGFLLLTPVLDCSLDSEPFASLAAARRGGDIPTYTQRGIHTTEELQIFARQAAWLRHAFASSPSDARGTDVTTHVIIRADNVLAATYVPRVTSSPDNRPFYLIPGKPTGRWPEILALKTPLGNTIRARSEQEETFARLTESQRRATSADVFAAVPRNIGAPPEASPPVSPPTSPTVTRRASPPPKRRHSRTPALTTVNAGQFLPPANLAGALEHRAVGDLPPAPHHATFPPEQQTLVKKVQNGTLHPTPRIRPPSPIRTPDVTPPLRSSEPKGILDIKLPKVKIQNLDTAPLTPTNRPSSTTTETQPKLNGSKKRTPAPLQLPSVALAYHPTALTPISPSSEYVAYSDEGLTVDSKSPDREAQENESLTYTGAHKSPQNTDSVTLPTLPKTGRELSAEQRPQPLKSWPAPRIIVRPAKTFPPADRTETWDTAIDIPLPQSSPEASPPDSPTSPRWQEIPTPLALSQSMLREPAIAVINLNHSEIATNPDVLGEPSVRRLTSTESWTPLVPPALHHADTDTEKTALINFIHRIRRRVAALATSLAQTVTRIKAWYL